MDEVPLKKHRFCLGVSSKQKPPTNCFLVKEKGLLNCRFHYKSALQSTKNVARNEMESGFKKGMSKSWGNTQAKTPTLFNRKEN